MLPFRFHLLATLNYNRVKAVSFSADFRTWYPQDSDRVLCSLPESALREKSGFCKSKCCQQSYTERGPTSF